jgi:hypothetical protein
MVRRLGRISGNFETLKLKGAEGVEQVSTWHTSIWSFCFCFVFAFA